MTNKNIFDFIDEKLNSITNVIFDSFYLFAYDGDYLTNVINNLDTLETEKIDYIPYSVISYESEAQPLSEMGIFQYTIPMEFAVRYSEKDTIPDKIEEFVELLNGKSFTINDKQVAWGATGISPIGTEELNAGDWVQITLTLFAYASNTYTGNDVTFVLNGSTVYPLQYSVAMDNQIETYAPQDKTYMTSSSNAKQHTRNFVLFYKIDGADTWVKECELNVINTEYPLVITYPGITPIVVTTTVKLKSGVGTIVNGTSIMYNLVFIDG